MYIPSPPPSSLHTSYIPQSKIKYLPETQQNMKHTMSLASSAVKLKLDSIDFVPNIKKN